MLKPQAAPQHPRSSHTIHRPLQRLINCVGILDVIGFGRDKALGAHNRLYNDPLRPWLDQGLEATMANPTPRKDDASMYTWTQPEGREMQHKNPEPPKISEAVATISTDSFWSLPQKPCVRQSLMAGIGAGAAIVGITVVARGKLRKALNVGVYSGVGITWASYEFCQYQKRQEATNMKRAVEVVREAKIQKEVAEQDARNAAAAAEAAARLEQTSKRPWYKFW